MVLLARVMSQRPPSNTHPATLDFKILQLPPCHAHPGLSHAKAVDCSAMQALLCLKGAQRSCEPHMAVVQGWHHLRSANGALVAHGLPLLIVPDATCEPSPNSFAIRRVLEFKEQTLTSCERAHDGSPTDPVDGFRRCAIAHICIAKRYILKTISTRPK